MRKKRFRQIARFIAQKWILKLKASQMCAAIARPYNSKRVVTLDALSVMINHENV